MATKQAPAVGKFVDGIIDGTAVHDGILRSTTYYLSDGAKQCLKVSGNVLILMPVTLYTVFTEIAFRVDPSVQVDISGKLGVFSQNTAPDSKEKYEAVDDQLFFSNDIPEVVSNEKVILFPNAKTKKDSVVGKTVFDMLSEEKKQTMTEDTLLYLGYTATKSLSLDSINIGFSALFVEKEEYYV